MGPMPQMSQAQKDQLNQLLLKEREYAAGLMKKLEENRIALHQLTEQEPFDEAKATALAKTQSDLQTDLMVSHLRAKARIKALFSSTHKN
jgi:Spy/CpxP family protein refolding chaperone